MDLFILITTVICVTNNRTEQKPMPFLGHRFVPFFYTAKLARNQVLSNISDWAVYKICFQRHKLASNKHGTKVVSYFKKVRWKFSNKVILLALISVGNDYEQGINSVICVRFYYRLVNEQ